MKVRKKNQMDLWLGNSTILKFFTRIGLEIISCKHFSPKPPRFKVDFDAFDNMATCPLQPKESIGSCGGLKTDTPKGVYWGKSLFKIATLFLVGELLYLDQSNTLRWATFRNAKLRKCHLLWKCFIVQLFFAPFTETWDGNSSALKLGQDAGFYSVFNEMKAVEFQQGLTPDRRKMKWHGNKHGEHSFQS